MKINLPSPHNMFAALLRFAEPQAIDLSPGRYHSLWTQRGKTMKKTFSQIRTNKHCVVMFYNEHANIAKHNTHVHLENVSLVE